MPEDLEYGEEVERDDRTAEVRARCMVNDDNEQQRRDSDHRMMIGTGLGRGNERNTTIESKATETED